MCELPSVYACDRPIARKEHKCYECSGVIRVGEKYHKHHGVWDGRGADYKVCNECEELRAKMDENVYDNEEVTVFGGLTDSVFDSHAPALIVPYIKNRRARGGEIRDWMIQAEEKSLKSNR